MNCPVCDAKLRQVHKHGVEVDICPDCKGVWLDRGELEKILDMVSEGGPAQVAESDRVPEQRRPQYRNEPRERERRYDEERPRDRDYDERGYDRHGKRRRGSWLGEIFESFGGGGDD